ncbi:glutamine--fructose-6-phosphate aminotransferase [Saccharobesus litoralis]|uniref:Glutamine--fructose-6-phosphate aminotransferase n=1 Tax=Saccharobesus litoralis TaxID=2172099 RepID=A0A2S0VPY4_9ALTE|nr:SIS domain-containing protein [Saccharobesus litoralis]AWB66277.1 glutamine--fructose-6-phosphate aminotransferase [Saccharobesus litoralis]
MTASTPLFVQEALETPERIANQLEENDHTTDKLGSHLRLVSPKFIYIVGRGSSDHAGSFAKYLFEIETGIPVVGATPSVTSAYGSSIKLDGALVLMISQSGRSQDVIDQARMAKLSGAYVVGLVNDENSPLAEECDVLLPLKAGGQKVIGATKTVLTTLSALLQLVAKWTHNKELSSALYKLPDLMEQACQSEPIITNAMLNSIEHCAVLGRGFGYAIAKEITMKLMGNCCIHAEPFSSAEFAHGAVGMIDKKLGLLSVDLRDEAFAKHQQQIQEFIDAGLTVHKLKQPIFNCPERLAPLTLLQRFYLDIANVAIERGIDPDRPPGMQKMIKTF